MEILIIVKLVGLLFIIIATYIATVKLPSINRLIQNESDNIDQFKDNRILAAISTSRASDLGLSARLNIMEANIVGYTNQKKESEIALRHEALEDLFAEIQNWCLLFTKGNLSDVFQDAKREAEKINSGDTTIEHKFKRMVDLLNTVRNAAFQRIDEAHVKRDIHKAQKSNIENRRLVWNNVFIWFQISGLCVIAGSEVIEKLISINS